MGNGDFVYIINNQIVIIVWGKEIGYGDEYRKPLDILLEKLEAQRKRAFEDFQKWKEVDPTGDEVFDHEYFEIRSLQVYPTVI